MGWYHNYDFRRIGGEWTSMKALELLSVKGKVGKDGDYCEHFPEKLRAQVKLVFKQLCTYSTPKYFQS